MIAVKKPTKTAYQKTPGQNISDLIRYILDARERVGGPAQEEDGEKVLCSGSLGFVFDDTDAQISEMIALAAQSRSAFPVDHWVLSWPTDETPTPAQAEEAPKIFLRSLGLSDHQAVWAVHQNTRHAHLHIAVNRVSPQGQTVRIGFEVKTSLRAVCEIEAKQGWKPEKNAVFIWQNGQAIPHHAYTPDGIRPAARQAEERTGLPSLERRAQALAPIISAAQNWQDLHLRIAERGATYEKRRGGAILRFTGRDGGTVKASTAAREASLSHLEKRLGSYERPKIAPRPYEPQPPPLRRGLSSEDLLLGLVFRAYGRHREADQILSYQQAADRAALRRQKFHAAEHLWAAQAILREEHVAARQAARAERNTHISTLKSMNPDDLQQYAEKQGYIEPDQEKQQQNHEHTQKRRVRR